MSHLTGSLDCRAGTGAQPFALRAGIYSCRSPVCTGKMDVGGGSCLGYVPALGAGPGHEAL